MHKLIDTRDWSESKFILRHPLNTDCRVMSLMLKMTGNPITMATDDKPNNSGEMDFKLLMKRGHKQMVKDLKVPLDSELAIGLKDTQIKAGVR